MTGAPRQLPPRSSSALLPVLAAVTYLAALVALWGFMSLILDRDVIDYPDANTLLGPAMAAIAVIVTGIVLLRTRRARSPWAGAVAAFFGSGAGMLVVALIGYGPVAVPHFAISPFIVGAAALSAVTVVATWAVHPRR